MPNADDATRVEQGGSGESAEEQNMSGQLWNKFFVGKAAVWTAVFTLVLCIFSGLLWKVNDKANDTSISTQRAFISFGGPVLVKDVQNRKLKGINVYYGMTNSGTTPASAAILEWNMSLGPTSPAKGVDFDTLSQNERMPLVLGPKANFQMKPVYLSVEELEMVAQNKKHLFFWGWVTYRDIFSSTPERLSEFCTDIASATWTAANHNDPNVDFKTDNPPCPIHNCYDQQCEDYSTRTKK